MLHKKKLGILLTALALTTAIVNSTNAAVFAETAGQGMSDNIVIDVLSFNDFHGNVLESGKNIGAAKLAGVIGEYKAKAESTSDYDVIALSAGDLYQGTAISNLRQGSPVSEMLKVIGIEASAIGNHEFDWSRSNFTTWAEEGNFDFLAANIVYKENGQAVDFAEPYKIIERNGINIAVVGLATQGTAVQTLPENVEDLVFLDPIETLNNVIHEIKATEDVDAIIALTHMGASQDSSTGIITGEAAELAESVDGLDAVIAAHNHAFVSGTVNRVPVVQAGYNGRGLSKLSFTFSSDKELISVIPSTQVFQGSEASLPVNETVKAAVERNVEELKPILEEKVTYIENELSHNRNEGLSKLGVAVSEAMRQIAGTQICINNGGGIRRPLYQGDVTVGDMYEILPFDNTIVTLSLKGSDLKTVIEHGIMPENFGWGQFSGIKVWYDENTGDVSSMILTDTNEEIEMDKYYTVATNDFIATGGDYYDFNNAKDFYNTNVVMRDSISEYWKANGVNISDYELLIAGEREIEEPAAPQEPSVPQEPSAPEETEQPQEASEVETPAVSSPSEEIKPDAEITGNSSDKTEDKLPQTGSIFGSEVMALLAAVSAGTGTLLLKSKRKIS